MTSEIHLHIEGSVYYEAADRISQRRKVPTWHPCVPRTKNEFFAQMNEISRVYLASSADYLDVLSCLHSRISATHDYVEVTVSAGAFSYYHDGDFGEILSEMVAWADGAGSPDTRFLLEILRNSGPDKCWEQMEIAKIAMKENGRVVGVSLAGDEARFPTRDYTEHICACKALSIPVTVHAGEWGNPSDVWVAVEAGADRIGHGIRSADDPLLMTYLRDHDVCLEVCPTSNLCTGASCDLRELLTLWQSGVTLSLNTDDPAVFDTTLRHELEIMRKLISGYKVSDYRGFGSQQRKTRVSMLQRSIDTCCRTLHG